jgi:hypothetical protein
VLGVVGDLYVRHGHLVHRHDHRAQHLRGDHWFLVLLLLLLEQLLE